MQTVRNQDDTQPLLSDIHEVWWGGGGNKKKKKEGRAGVNMYMAVGRGMDHGRIDGWAYARMGRALADDINVWGRRGGGL